MKNNSARRNKCEERNEDNNIQMGDFLDKEYQVEWTIKMQCPPHIDTSYTGSYYIRITGECSEDGLVSQEKKQRTF